jgi:hypothetical protein
VNPYRDETVDLLSFYAHGQARAMLLERVRRVKVCGIEEDIA